MSAGKILLVIVGAFVALAIILGLWTAATYNHLVSLEQDMNSKWAQVQNVYQRRADLVPNLVATVSGAANFEKSTLTAVTDARASVGRVQLPSASAPTDASQLAAFDRAQGQLGAALSRLLVVSENYPNLTATANFRDLQSQLEGTENRIAVERRNFNDSVQAYNTGIKSFPAVLIAGMFGHTPHPYFSAAPGAETAPKVNFDFSNKS
ncbi:MAG TPA: LemA family protein [Opitutaceae bacterium]|nr:LemA family protein [Opitutaceae bacterium]